LSRQADRIGTRGFMMGTIRESVSLSGAKRPGQQGVRCSAKDPLSAYSEITVRPPTSRVGL
jgi:hypothetical protein